MLQFWKVFDIFSWQADMQRHGISGISCKRKADPMWKSDVKEVEVAPTVVHQVGVVLIVAKRCSTSLNFNQIPAILTKHDDDLLLNRDLHYQVLQAGEVHLQAIHH